ncbi:MAG: guanylate kinase [Prevotella sp.]|nr:guanylate kinase [Prevotella sp.]
MKKQCFGYETAGITYDILRRFSKDHRRYMTPAESALWELLRGKQFGYRFRRQHPIGDYIPDFVCLPKRLVIEVDGGYHFVGNQSLSDQERTIYLNQHGFAVLRFTNDEVIGNTEYVMKRIQEVMDNQPTINSTGSAQPLPSFGGVGGGLVIFSAPSGSGKSTIVNWLMQEHPELRLYFSISCTSRPPRGTEQDGVEYFFLTPEEFRQKIEHDEFLEYEEVYEDRFYGTLKAQVERQLAQGQNVVFDVDVKGGVNIKRFYGERALSLFIQPPSIEELRRRLEGRGTDTPEAIEARLAKASYELTFAPQFDHIVVNDDLEQAKRETLALIKTFLSE